MHIAYSWFVTTTDYKDGALLGFKGNKLENELMTVAHEGSLVDNCQDVDYTPCCCFNHEHTKRGSVYIRVNVSVSGFVL